MIRRCRALIDQPLATKRRASQSSKSRVCRGLAPQAVVVGRAHQAFAKVPEPDSVHDHSGRQADSVRRRSSWRVPNDRCPLALQAGHRLQARGESAWGRAARGSCVALGGRFAVAPARLRPHCSPSEALPAAPRGLARSPCVECRDPLAVLSSEAVLDVVCDRDRKVRHRRTGHRRTRDVGSAGRQLRQLLVAVASSRLQRLLDPSLV